MFISLAPLMSLLALLVDFERPDRLPQLGVKQTCREHHHSFAIGPNRKFGSRARHGFSQKPSMVPMVAKAQCLSLGAYFFDTIMKRQVIIRMSVMEICISNLAST